ncbi:DNA segregation ATPase FtsK/SpoIIIE, S-DNA-T family [Parafrankia irregularis]|uniref:DNA segregation ATPase FtsK/SpoIIIE, S-DNA-T family n=1 Tax=Parafrankia irregularis TaxID=795642 RepID=A0A0S4R0W0_9ACTN|nr:MULTISPECIES: FtsK/SpoIIIE domain-containing protein [Parafrankia]MBE3200672.1 cell division protein FtsK [Parafrankia sp. CH37]CUU60502.1 DNA segregation ATPase FtsK/SpoIIIE, S-DNA-T family [Parafrankia irregularis]
MHVLLSIENPADRPAPFPPPPALGPPPVDIRGDVLVQLRPTSTVGELAASLADPAPTCFLGTRPLDPRATVRGSGIVPGLRLGLDTPPRPVDPLVTHTGPALWFEVRVVGGPDAGRVWRVGPGAHDIGAAAGSAIELDDDGVPPLAAVLHIGHSGDTWLTGISPTGVRTTVPSAPELRRTDEHRAALRVEHRDLPLPPEPPDWPEAGPGAPGCTPWEVGSDLVVGPVLLRLAEPFEPDAAITPAEDVVGHDFNRPPRIVPPLLTSRRRFPTPPSPPGRRPVPVLMMIAPMLLGLAFVWFFHSFFFLVIMLFSPILAFANWSQDRRSGRRRYREECARYRTRRAAGESDLRTAVLAERLARCDAAPDPAAIGLTATGPGHRLWERRRTDPDHLLLRVGTVDQPSLIEVDDPALDDYDRQLRWNVPEVPLAVDLPGRGVVGVAGERSAVHALARWLLAQCAVLHSPRDLQLVVLTDAASRQSWEWVRWLPHARPAAAATGHGPFALIGNDPETVAHRVAELQAQIRARQSARGSALGPVMFTQPDVVVLVDGARRLRDVPGMIQVLTDGPAVRIFAICLDTETRLLPEECTAVVRCDGGGGGNGGGAGGEGGVGSLTVRQSDIPEVPGVRPDLVLTHWCEQVARALAPLRDISPDTADGLPDRVRLLDLLGLAEPDQPELPAVVAAAWAARPASTRFPLGTGFDGPVVLDLVRDGPHALVAGTTGAGKSELLQSLVGSLAAHNRPDELVFVLVDYKGGSAFRGCARLPHTLGMVTDLDPALAVRALESLAAELRRREEVLAAAAAKDIVHYRSLRAREPGLPALPRLLLVIDEFATLAREVPDFIPGLVSLAQRGRSLGIHLVLATQRPAGVVTGDIRANTNLRIALRVTDPMESSDVVDTPDAALIPAAAPGRALTRLAHRSTLLFQTAYCGAPYPSTHPAGAATPGVSADAAGSAASAASAASADSAGFAGFAGPRGAGDEPAAVPLSWTALGRPLPIIAAPAGTDPDQAADDLAPTDLDVLVDAIRAAADRTGHEPQPSPWLPALRQRVLFEDLLERCGPGAVPYALEDVPSRQLQRPVCCELGTFGHLYVIGSPRSGRSQVLRTLAGGLARVHSCADVHLYGIDAAGGALAVLDELPHCGAVVTASDLERVGRLCDRLTVELARRQSLLAEYSCAGLDELRAAMPAGTAPAHLVLFVDGWDSLAATLPEHDGGRLYDALLALLREGTGAGIHVVATADRGLLAGRAGGMNDHRVLLRMGERTDYATIRVPPQRVPAHVPPGRGWRSVNQAELQIALLDPDPAGQAQADALRRIATRAGVRDRDVPADRRPFPVAALPRALTFADAFARVPEAERGPLRALLGLGGDEAAPMTLDFAGRAHTFLVAGPPGSGRSNTLATLAVSLLAGGTRLVVVTPRDSPLRRLAAHPQVTLAGMDSLQVQGPAVVLVDDVDLFGFNAPLDPPLREIVAAGRDRGVGLAYAGSGEILSQSISGWLGEARRSRQGVLLAPQSSLEGDLLGTRIPPSLLRGGIRPGRGYVTDATGTLRTITIPHTVLR